MNQKSNYYVETASVKSLNNHYLIMIEFNNEMYMKLNIKMLKSGRSE